MSGIRTSTGIPVNTDFSANPLGAVELILNLTTGNLYALKSDSTVVQVGIAGSTAWGTITGTLSAQTDLQSALNAKGVGDMLKADNLSGLANYTTARSNLGLGSAATTASTAYATAAQGTTADSALQPAGNGGSLTGLTKTQVGLANADNTSDASKPVSTATQTALDAKQSTSAKGTANGYAGLDGAGLVPLSQLPGLPAAWGTITGVLATQTDLQNALDAKQATLVSGTNIKTVNGSTLLGSGDLTVNAADPSYTPGSFTVATGTGRMIIKRLQLTTTQRSTVAGTGRLRMIN